MGIGDRCVGEDPYVRGSDHKLGLEVVLLEAGSCLMSRQLNADATALLDTRVCETGMRTIVGVRARRIETRDDQPDEPEEANDEGCNP